MSPARRTAHTTPPPPERVVMCMKWGINTQADAVNRLYAMVRRHVRGPLRFICLTDRRQGVRAEVECRPIPALDLPPQWAESNWLKLAALAVDDASLQGRNILLLDLSVVIVQDISPLFEVEGEFLLIHDWTRPWRRTGNAAVMRWRAGQQSEVLDALRLSLQAPRWPLGGRLRSVQGFLSDTLFKLGRLDYWPSDWCRSYTYHCLPGWPANYWRTPQIPKGARIIVFHGDVGPADALAGRRNRLLRAIRPAPWVGKHWRE